MCHNKEIILKLCLLVTCFFGLALSVYGGGDTTCPSDAFPTRLSPGAQGRTLASVSMYIDPWRTDAAISEMPPGTRFTVSTDIPDPACAEKSLWVYVETGSGFYGWIREVFQEQYLLEPLTITAPFSAPLPDVMPATFAGSDGPGQVDYNGVRFNVSADIATQVDAQFVPVSDDRGYRPAHFAFRLTHSDGRDNYMMIRVMSAQDVNNFYPGTIATLRDVLDGVPGAKTPYDLLWAFSDAGM